MLSDSNSKKLNIQEMPLDKVKCQIICRTSKILALNTDMQMETISGDHLIDHLTGKYYEITNTTLIINKE